jgi:toxin ParE1/3/4
VNEYELSARARLDLLEIWEHIADRDVDAADRVLADLRGAMVKLAEFPGLGHRRADVADARYLFWRVHSFIIVYLPETRPLAISRVVHGRRDFRTLFPHRPNP